MGDAISRDGRIWHFLVSHCESCKAMASIPGFTGLSAAALMSKGKALFAQADKDNSGELSKTEAKSFVKSNPQLRALFQVGVDGKGWRQFWELLDTADETVENQGTSRY